MSYWAFLSYSHRDKAVAAWLHRSLETYRIPTKLVGTAGRFGPVPRRLTPIFRDREELPASGDLGAELTSALAAARFLIVICSPAAASSRWVNEEILAFKRAHGDNHVLALIAAGEPGASSHPDTAAAECFPPALRYRLSADGQLSSTPAEPIAADIRKDADGRRLAKLKIVAGLTGLKLDDLVQRETHRRLRRMAFVSAAAMVGMLLAVSLALYANARRIEANDQRKIAEREAATARAASDYLVETFRLSNPAAENPRTITALTILNRSAERAQRELADQPVVQARLVAALGQAYNGLGLFNEAASTIGQSMPAIRSVGLDGVEARLTLAATHLGKGRLDDASALVREVTQLLGEDTSARPDMRAQAAIMDARISIAKYNVPRGLAAFDRAIALYRAAPRIDSRRLAIALQNKGILLSDDGQFEAAEAALMEALGISRRVLGDNHILTGQTWFALAQNAFLAGRLPAAGQRIARALAVERQVLDPDNPIIADALSMQGQILHGEGKLDEADAALREAVAIYRKAFGGPHYLIGIAEVYRALIASDRGRTADALARLDAAKRNYDASYGKLHANHGDLLVNRATILDKAGRYAEAKADCAAGLKILDQTIGSTASFTRTMAKTCADITARSDR